MENDKPKKSISTITAEWSAMLCVVLLFASAVNCLFLSLSYGKAFDIILLLTSLGLAIFSYLYALDPKRTPSLKKRVIIAVACVITWAILIPLLKQF